VPYDPAWPELFRQEKEHLLSCLPNDLIRGIEHFGSTAVPGLAAKPIVDMLVETCRKGLSDIDVAEARGWASLAALKASYKRPDAEWMLAVVMHQAELREVR